MSAPELLATVVRDLALARDLGTVTSIVRREARRVSGADGVTFVLRDGAFCYYVDEDASAPLRKGRRFLMADCISGGVLRHGRAVAIADVYQDDRVPRDAYRATFVKSLAMVPVRPQDPASPERRKVLVVEDNGDAGALIAEARRAAASG